MSTVPNLADVPLHAIYSLLQPLTLHSSSPRATFTNWGQTFTCTPLAVFEPQTEYQCELILELARRERKSVRAVGVGHSPSDLACTSEYMLRTEKLNRILEVRLFVYLYLCVPMLSCGDLTGIAIQTSASRHRFFY
jgi:L-gulonolactone oxidase